MAVQFEHTRHEAADDLMDAANPNFQLIKTFERILHSANVPLLVFDWVGSRELRSGLLIKTKKHPHNFGEVHEFSS